MNKDFEKLPEIAERLSRVEWDDNIKRYRPRTTDKDTMMCAKVNGALYAYQEQQRKIDTVLKAIEWHIEDCGIGEDTEYNKAWLQAMLFVKKELLK